MNPQEYWNYGIQMVALNYETSGLMMDIQVCCNLLENQIFATTNRQ